MEAATEDLKDEEERRRWLPDAAGIFAEWGSTPRKRKEVRKK